MGGVLGCFGRCKDDDCTRKKRRNKRIHVNQRHELQNTDERRAILEHGASKRVREPVNVVPEQIVLEEKFSASPKKRVTFNSNVEAYEPVLVGDSTDSSLEEDKVRKEFKEDVVKSKDDDSVSGEDSITSSTGSYPENHRYQNCRLSDDEAEEYGDSDLGDNDDDGCDVVGELGGSQDKEEYDDSDLDDNDDDGCDVVGELGGSQDKELRQESVVTELTGLRTKNDLVRMNSEEVDSPFIAPGLADEGNGVKAGYARGRSTYAHPVLNPVENLTQWKAMKSKGTPLPSKPQKENSTADFEAPRMSLSSELTFRHLSSLSKAKPNQLKSTDQDVAVDASLSNWLVSPEPTLAKKTNRSSGQETIASGRSTSQCSNSVVSFEDRPILGALTVEELRHMSATNSPRKSPTHSPDDMPIIGTVGSYWNDTSSTKGPRHTSTTNSRRKSPTHSPDDMVIIGSVGTYWSNVSSVKDSARSDSSFKGIPNTTSKYREDNEVKWHSTPFETRLERALNRSERDAKLHES